MAKRSDLTTVIRWIDARLPLVSRGRAYIATHRAPPNLNFWYCFGALALLVLLIQLVSGLFLAMHYIPDTTLLPDSSMSVAFYSIEHLMRDVPGGRLLRYMHSTGASCFFIVLYLHLWRALLYGAYQKPRELVWILGVLLFFVLMAEAFLGYLLPWGQMSYWGAQVVTNLLASIPWIGESLANLLRGDFTLSGATLTRFFALHVIAIPLLLLFLAKLHLQAQHQVGSTNPGGVESRDANGQLEGGIPVHPYYTVKDLFAIALFLIFFVAIVFFAPNLGGYFLEPANFVAANPLRTPDPIVPMWYFAPFYSMLRAVPAIAGSQFAGLLVVSGALLCWLFLPWLDRGHVRSIRQRNRRYKISLSLFLIVFLLLGYLGTLPSGAWGSSFTAHSGWAHWDWLLLFTRLGTALYFAFFAALPWLSQTAPEPEWAIRL